MGYFFLLAIFNMLISATSIKQASYKTKETKGEKHISDKKVHMTKTQKLNNYTQTYANKFEYLKEKEKISY